MSGPILTPSSDGVTVAVHELTSGGPGRDVLLVCHATGFCGRAYEPLAEELATKFHVFAVDFRGHGDSGPPANGNFNWGSMADDLLAAVDAIGGGPILGFGHSLGGGLLMHAERRRPGTLRAAYVYEPIVLPAESFPPGESQGPDHMSETAARRRPSFPSKAEALARYASRPPLSELQAGALAAYVEHGMRTAEDGAAWLKCTPENEAACFAADGKPRLDQLCDVTVPVTVAIGTLTRGWTPAHFGLAVADALPNGRLERHSLLGHFGPLQGPITVGAMVLESLGS